MARKNDVKAVKVKELDDLLVLKASRPLDEEQFKLLSKLVREEEKASGVKIVLIPNSVELVESSDQVVIEGDIIKQPENPVKQPTIVNLDGTVEEVNAQVTAELGEDVLRDLLKAEQEDKNRKGVIEHIESLLKEENE